MFGTVPYIPGVKSTTPEPLSRYLPPIPDGVVSTWLRDNILPGSWILDPFSASPRLAVEIARTGYRLLVTANNPIARFLLEMAANPPDPEELKSSLAELAASYKGEERIELHIRSLYNTLCARCGQVVSADAFVWEHGNPSPYMRIYTCPSCGDTGEHPCTSYDSERASQFTISGLHKARALERVVAANDQDRIHVEQALAVYLPRALYALITLINKIEGLNISKAGQKYLAALLLHAFDQANALWRVPGPRGRRRQLIIPRHFRENNIWLALEEGIELWTAGITQANPSIPVSVWPDEPPETGGICIHEGRLSSIAESLSNLNIKAVCAAIPRPNQAYWTLSALWTGWLWGREAVRSYKGVLHRQRYDWGWHTTALNSVFKQLRNILDPSASIFGLLGEAEPGFIAASLLAAGYAGCSIESMAIRPEEEQAQIMWKCQNGGKLIQNTGILIDTGIKSARRYLENRGEPASYLNTISAVFMDMVQIKTDRIEYATKIDKVSLEADGKPVESSEQTEANPSMVYSTVYNAAREALSYRSGFLRFTAQDLSDIEAENKNQVIQSTLFSVDLGKFSQDEEEAISAESPATENEATEKERPTRSSDISESSMLWLRESDNVNHISITDNYEVTLFNYLATHPGCNNENIDEEMCKRFPGLYTPDVEFIQICLESYGEKDSTNDNLWHLRAEDMPGEREKDIGNAARYIHQVGDRLAITCTDQKSSRFINAVTWLDGSGDLNYWFFPVASAVIGEIVLYSDFSPQRGFIVLPGSRANLVLFKLRHDPRLSKSFHLVHGNWRFLKFRHLKSLAENPMLNRDNLEQLLMLDPLTYSTPQLRLI